MIKPFGTYLQHLVDFLKQALIVVPQLHSQQDSVA